MPQVLPRLPLQAAPADTVAVDTLTFADRLRADSTFFRLSDPAELSSFYEALLLRLADVGLWLGLLAGVLKALLILLIAYLLLRVIDKTLRGWAERFVDLPTLHPRRQRALTIGNLISSTARYVIWPLALIMILSEMGVNVGALIATAGVAGLAIGFGAQTLVKDVISGVFLLFDNTLHIGDLVLIGSEAGTVEHIGVRLIKVRKFDGTLLMVPAGELRIFGNRSIGFARAIVEIGVTYEQDLDTILPIVERVAGVWADERRAHILEEKPLVQAIMSFADSSVNIRVVVQMMPGEQFQAERDLRLMLKREFDRLNIEIPFPRRTVYMREEKALPPRTVEDRPAAPPRSDEEDPLESD